jgi:hypothetical protein
MSSASKNLCILLRDSFASTKDMTDIGRKLKDTRTTFIKAAERKKRGGGEGRRGERGLFLHVHESDENDNMHRHTKITHQA